MGREGGDQGKVRGEVGGESVKRKGIGEVEKRNGRWGGSARVEGEVDSRNGKGDNGK